MIKYLFNSFFNNSITTNLLNKIASFMTYMNLYFTTPKNAANKLMLDPKYNFLNFLITYTILAIIIIAAFIFNSNILYLIDLARENPVELDKIFPSNCQSAPYGPHMIYDDQGYPKKEDGKIIFRNICDRLYETPLDSKCHNLKTHQEKDINICPSWPYTEFTAGDNLKVTEDYVNWLLRSIAETNTGLHRLVKELIYGCTKFTNRFVLIFLATLLFGLLGTFIIPCIYYGLIVFINELGYIFDNTTSDITKIFAIILFFMTLFIFNPAYSMFQSVHLTLKLIIYPMIQNKESVLNIFFQNKDLLAIILGGYYVICAQKYLSSGVSGFISFIYSFIFIGYILFNIFSYFSGKIFS
jgi:hypothetical protein